MTVSLQKLAKEIVQQHKMELLHFGQAFTARMEQGRLAKLAKEQVKHGEWMPWCKDNLPYSGRTASRRIAEWDFFSPWDRDKWPRTVEEAEEWMADAKFRAALEKANLADDKATDTDKATNGQAGAPTPKPTGKPPRKGSKAAAAAEAEISKRRQAEAAKKDHVYFRHLNASKPVAEARKYLLQAYGVRVRAGKEQDAAEALYTHLEAHKQAQEAGLQAQEAAKKALDLATLAATTAADLKIAPESVPGLDALAEFALGLVGTPEEGRYASIQPGDDEGAVMDNPGVAAQLRKVEAIFKQRNWVVRRIAKVRKPILLLPAKDAKVSGK